MTELLNTGIPIWMVICWMLFMALVQGAPRPRETSSTAYVWLYGSLHWLSVNWKLALNPRNFPAHKRLLDRQWNKDNQ